MTTRYSLPRDGDRKDTARGARTLAALVLVFTVLALTLLAAIVPSTEPAVAAVPEPQPAAAPTFVGA
jgi:hypothetical protein